MTKPWFPMYAPDFIASTMSMSPEVVGAYIRLLCYAWMSGGIPDDLTAVQRITGGLSEEGWAEIRARLQPDGDRDGDRSGDRVQRLVHPRMERERQRVETIAEARRTAAHNTNRKRRDGDRDGQRSGDRSGDRSGQRHGDRSGDRLYPQPQVTDTPHLTVGGSRGEGRVNSSKQADSSPAASTAGGLEGAVSRPGGQDGSTPHPDPSDAPTGILRVSAIGRMRNPTGEEMQRIMRWPGNRRMPQEAIDAKRNWLEKAMVAKGIDPDLRVASWEAAVANWVATGIDPYEYVKDTLLSDWVNVRSPNAVIRHRLGASDAA